MPTDIKEYRHLGGCYAFDFECRFGPDRVWLQSPLPVQRLVVDRLGDVVDGVACEADGCWFIKGCSEIVPLPSAAYWTLTPRECAGANYLNSNPAAVMRPISTLPGSANTQNSSGACESRPTANRREAVVARNSTVAKSTGCE